MSEKKPRGPRNLIWLDLEMTGLDPERNHIIEIAAVATDEQLNVLENGPNLVVHRPATDWEVMDDWCRKQHTKSGLWKQVGESTISIEEASRTTVEFALRHVKKGETPLCGNSIWQDRRFLRRHMPTLDAVFHYRIVDVSTVKELAQSWYPTEIFEKGDDGKHRALDDIHQSIAELRAYRERIFKPVPTGNPAARK